MSDSLNRKLARLVMVCLTVTQLLASEHRGVVKSGGIPIPGATVTAVQGDRKVSTTTDDQGAYVFPNLADGNWNISIEMLGFGKQSLEVGVVPNAPSPVWELKQLSAGELQAALGPAPVAAAKPAAPSGRPELVRRQQQAGAPGGRGTGFQRVDVNASESAGEAANAAGAEMVEAVPELAQSSNDALVIGGSVSSGIGMPVENDWNPGGRGPFGPDGMGFGPPGMMMGPGGLGPGA
jgi:hypothetical protein